MAVVMDNMHGHVRLYTSSTQVLTLLQGTTAIDHTPFWSKIGSHLMVIFNM